MYRKYVGNPQFVFRNATFDHILTHSGSLWLQLETVRLHNYSNVFLFVCSSCYRGLPVCHGVYSNHRQCDSTLTAEVSIHYIQLPKEIS